MVKFIMIKYIFFALTICYQSKFYFEQVPFRFNKNFKVWIKKESHIIYWCDKPFYFFNFTRLGQNTYFLISRKLLKIVYNNILMGSTCCTG
jgi:hypothetical protein